MLLDKIQADLKTSQLQKQADQVSTLRLLLSETQNARISKGEELLDEEIQAVISREIKKRKEAAAGFRSGGREEAALKEESEAKILLSYLPPQMTDEELTQVVTICINEVGAKTLADMGRVIGLVKAKVGQAADPGRISLVVKESLNKNG